MQERVHLRRDGVSVVVDFGDRCLPSIVHWGADLGPLTAQDLAAMVSADAWPTITDTPDVPIRASVLPEANTGWVGRRGIRGSRDGRDWSPLFVTSLVLLDGADLAVSAGAVGHALSVVADDRDSGLGLEITIELVEGGLLRSRASLTNTGESGYQLDDLVLAYPVPPAANEVFDFAGRWSNERVPQRRDLTVGTHLRESYRGRTGPDAATVLHAGSHGFGFASGEVWGVHVAWSGNHTHYAEHLATGHRSLGGGELLLPGEVRLAAGESYTSPWLYGSHGIGLDAVAARFHAFLRSRASHPAVPRPVTLNTWEAVYFDHALEPLLELADRAAEIGVERFVLDDGWFGARRDATAGLGDWFVSPEAWPEGLTPLVDRVRAGGMQFGLWVEPEMVNPDSDVARAHPDWIMAPAGRTPPTSRHQQVLNLGIPECFAAVKDALSTVIGDYAIDYLKWDHNRDLVDAGTQPGGRPGVHRQTAAAYRLMAELKLAFPGLEIESCSSGGGRVDLGILEHTDRVWVSDCIDPLERQQMLRWSAHLLPMELLGSHVASPTSHTTGRTHSLGFRAATALFGHFGVEWDLLSASDDERGQLAEWIAFHIANRGLFHSGDLVRVDAPDESVVLTGVIASDRSRAVFSEATVGWRSIDVIGRIRFPGLDPERRYRIRPLPLSVGAAKPARWWGTELEGIVLPGRVLAESGVMDAQLPPEEALVYLIDAVPENQGR